MKITLTYDTEDILCLCQDDAKKKYPDMSCRPWVESDKNPEITVEVTGK